MIKIPAISTIEFTNACNFSCSYCQRTDEDGKRKNGMLKESTIDNIIKNDGFSGTSYIELQQNGEPTINPNFNKFVEKIKSQVKYVGMSTNASFLSFKHNPLEGVKMLDCLTISIHKETKLDDINNILEALDLDRTKVRIQTLNHNWNNVEMNKIIEKGKIFFDNYNIREFRKDYGKKKFCMDLNSSVTIQYDGDVVPCCNVVGKQKVLGNVNNNSIKQIWEEHDKKIFNYCSTCETPSPFSKRLYFFTQTMEN